MTDRVLRGRLGEADAAPARGESSSDLARLGNTRVEQILSGELEGPVDYLQQHDEWVVLLEGAATLEVDGDRLDVSPGEWLLLPAGTPHRLVRTAPGSSWLAVHVSR